MSYKSISASYPLDKDLPARVNRLRVLKGILDGSFYEILPYQYDQETTGANESIPYARRAPSITSGSNILRATVFDSVKMLFGEGRFPVIQCEDETTRMWINQWIAEDEVVAKMSDAASRGSVGSVALQLRVLTDPRNHRARAFLKVHDTLYLTPRYDANVPDRLVAVVEKRKVRGCDLVEAGYTIADDDLNAWFWYQVVYDEQAETAYVPWLVSEQQEAQLNGKSFRPRVDKHPERTIVHRLGFCPWVWIKNLASGDDIDGPCTFQSGIETAVSVDYMLSHASRTIRFNSDPTLFVTMPATQGMLESTGGDFGGNMEALENQTMVMDVTSDAKFLEINGSVVELAVKLCEKLRSDILEAIHGVRVNPDHMDAHQGAKSLEIMHAPMIRLCDSLRSSYGEGGLLNLLRMLLQVAASKRLYTKAGKPVPSSLAPAEALTLSWNSWFPDTQTDLNQQAQTLVALTDGGILSRATATAVVSPDYDIVDVEAETQAVEADRAAEDARALALSAQVKASENLSA